MNNKIKMSEIDFIELVVAMQNLEFCIMREAPMCEGDCANCLASKMLEIIDCGY